MHRLECDCGRILYPAHDLYNCPNCGRPLVMAQSTTKEVITKPAQEMCERCGVNPANPSHFCPYQAEINGDYETECNCCDDCAQECAWEV